MKLLAHALLDLLALIVVDCLLFLMIAQVAQTVRGPAFTPPPRRPPTPRPPRPTRRPAWVEVDVPGDRRRR